MLNFEGRALSVLIIGCENKRELYRRSAMPDYLNPRGLNESSYFLHSLAASYYQSLPVRIVFQGDRELDGLHVGA